LPEDVDLAVAVSDDFFVFIFPGPVNAKRAARQEERQQKCENRFKEHTSFLVHGS